MVRHKRSDIRSTASTNNRGQPSKVAVPAEPLREYSAQQLAQAYDCKTVAADQQFKDKRSKVPARWIPSIPIVPVIGSSRLSGAQMEPVCSHNSCLYFAKAKFFKQISG